ncbi:MAG: DASS family sodium-coupled anion symporter [Acidobacteria bacterium]|nr:DASS family sodium-coupled anion symporter [Acidobacteriota bacterium]
MPEKSSGQTARQKIGLIGGIILFLLVLLAPTPVGMSPAAQRMAAVTLLMATWWISEAIAIPLTSLLPLALFPVLGIMASEKVAPYYADHTIYLFLGGFIVALAIQKWNLHKRIALHIIGWVGTEPSRLLLGFMLATGFLSMWMSNTACAMMMFPIGMAVVLQLAGENNAVSGAGSETGQSVFGNFGSVLMLGIAYSAGLGGLGTLIGTPPNLVFAGTVKRLFPDAPEIGFLQWMKVGVPLAAISLPLTWFYLCRFGARVPLRYLHFSGSQTVIEEELRKLGKITRQEKYVLGIWVSMALLWIFRSPIHLDRFTIPGWAQLFGTPSFLHDATVAMVMALLLCLIPVKIERSGTVGSPERHFLINWETIRHGVPWGILLLFGGGFAMAAGFEQTGLSDWIGSWLSGMAGLPPILLVAATCLVVTLLSELTSNTATAVMAMPVLAAVASQVGIHPFLVMLPGALAASFGFMLPVATPPNAIVFGSGWITIPQMARAGLFLDLAGVVLITATVYLLGMSVFGITPGQMPAWVK